VDIRVTRYTDPVVRQLEARVQQEYVERYGGPDVSPVDPTQFDPPDGAFLVAWTQDHAVACGGFRRHDERSAEVKRMYVVPEHRREGLARAVLGALEDHARRAGYARILLETGTAQPEAMALYASSGYLPVVGFGHYAGSPLSRGFGKDLAVGQV
jgi:GNAT superfamily N-acetyltransferase